MSRLVSNYTANGSTLTDEYGTLFALSDLIGNSGVIKGMAVAANSSPAMNVYVQPGSAAVGTGTSPSNYSYFVKIDTTGQGEEVTIETAASSPRIDYIVAYVNKGQQGTTDVSNNTNNVFLLADVPGTPATSPAAPTTAQILAAIGASNPYIVLAQVAVGANVTQITNANITDLRTFASIAPSNLILSLGKEILPTDIGVAMPSGTITPAQIPGASVTVTVPAGVTLLKVTLDASYSTSTANSYAEAFLYQGVVGEGTQIAQCNYVPASSNYRGPCHCVAYVTVTPGSTYVFNGGCAGAASSTVTFYGESVTPIILAVETA